MNTPSTARTQWHPPFCTSLQVELRSDRENLEFQEEFQVRKLPGRVDTLIIMKDPSKPVHKSIGQIFVKYNLIEYKPPGDSLTIDDYFYMIGNASLLKSNSKAVDKILYSDISITFVCYRHPRKLMRFLVQDLKRKVEKVSAGIYHITGELFKAQIIVYRVLDNEEYLWLTSLRKGIEKEVQVQLMEEYKKHKDESEFVELMNFIVNINQTYFQGREQDMCQALMEIVRDEIEKEKEEAVEKARPFIIQNAEPEIIRKSNMRLAKSLKDCLDDKTIAVKLSLPLEVVRSL